MSDKKISFTEGILLAVIPILGYWFAYLYQLGYAAYFDLPPAYIEINTTAVLSAVIGMLTAFAILHTLLDSFYPLIQSMPDALRLRIFKSSLLVVIFSGFAVAFKWPIETLLLYGIPAFLLYLLVQFALPLLFYRDTKGYIAKLEIDTHLDRKVPRAWDLGNPPIFSIS